MVRSSFVKKLSIAAASVAFVAMGTVGMGEAKANPLVNGDFETGDLTGWTTFTTTNGTLGPGFPNVVPFDTNNDGINSLSAQFRVGQQSFIPGQFSGGGIFQNVNLFAGDLTIEANIASLAGSIGNASGGLFELLFDGVVLDSVNFGSISANQTKFDLLTNVSNIVAGMHEIRFRVTRPFTQTSGTPKQYIDDIKLSGTAVTPVPEPASVLGLLAVGTLGATIKRKQKDDA